MTDTANSQKVIGSGAGITESNRANDRNVARPRDLPGIVIFLHGVNDPGANYETVEQGLCKGLGERLNRPDFVAGAYGAAYKDKAKQKAKGQSDRETEVVLADPDTYLYQRTGKGAHSVFIPFYWGYRADPKEILKDKAGKPTQLRSQYQDVRGNRLDANFAKAGGMFNNATTNIPDMYGPGFASSYVSRTVLKTAMSNYQFSGTSPERHYFVLAAERLAMLVSEIRAVAPDETVNIMGHSQGTIITLLAQALLHDKGLRCADCVIMVDSPYSLGEHGLMTWATQPNATQQTSQAKLNTLINIVTAVTEAPHRQPPLDQLCLDNVQSGGRAGYKWTPQSGTREDQQRQLCVFPERDNRGRVYLYFCPEDSTVDLPIVKGIGTHGVPDTVTADDYYWDGNHTRPQSETEALAAMNKLKELNFRQRVWTKHLSGNKPLLVGTAPQYVDVYKSGRLFINGDQLKPTVEPSLYGGEAKRGTPDKAGLEAPDAVSQNLALGNSYANLQWVRMPDPPSWNTTPDALKQQFNVGKGTDDQTNAVRVEFTGGIGATPYVLREETPAEARQRMSQNPAALADKDPTGVLTENSYHSAILRDPQNHRWVTAMDVAVGQAKSLDNLDWQALWVAIADWKTPLDKIKALSKFSSLTSGGQELVLANCEYYASGKFPTKYVSKTLPSLVESQTMDQRKNPERPQTPPIDWNFSGLR
ncbi:DUF3274 domain-containing protein [Paraburkholderia sp. 1N]|uniref:DUF3274 domain-containing protein n=1 Tax=Paraburkholderia solitsugae TaxID=2675748 RepID=A0ABX2BMA4_9BURK|nr:DUF3274 domain-containing protein [Paraburkholderia solitsugae]NPT41789.1 DUF3274 domain-containing protein [Paraburkholderia solitsugae]